MCSDELYGDFEDLETGEAFDGKRKRGDDSDSSAEEELEDKEGAKKEG